jgi:exosortase B
MHSQGPRLLAPVTWVEWWPVVVGLVGMYVPTYLRLAHDTWTTDDQAHGPIVLAISIWLLWRQRRTFWTLPKARSPVAGSISLTLGVLAYVVGRSQSVPLLDVGSQIPILIGIVLCVYAWPGLRIAWFPILLLVFLIPLPGILVDVVTAPLKEYVSLLTERFLYFAGYPIARDGVTLAIGPYQLLVADACSGLHSMYSLLAVGLLYVYLTKPKGYCRKAVLVLSMVPIAFIANLVRVITLVLITYHFGDVAGQGFLHGFAGVLLFSMALGLLFCLDSLLSLTSTPFAIRQA